MKSHDNKIGSILLILLMIGAANLWGADNSRLSLKRLALVVGANNGGEDRVLLQYAVKDAESIADVLGEMGGVGADDCRLLVDPDRRDFFSGMDAIGAEVRKAKETNRRVEFLFYYSGHSDEYNLMIGKEKIAYEELRKAIEKIDADLRIAILDSCASGAFTRLKGGKKKPAFHVDTSHDMRGYAFLTSSSADEASQESDRLEGSFFTHYLTSGLRGAADVSQDGRVTLTEAYQYAFNETIAQTEKSLSGPQHPNYNIAMTGTGDVIMTDIRQSSAVLTIAKDISGRVFIHNRNNVLVVELVKSLGQNIDLGLAEGIYRVINIRSGKIYESRIALISGKSTRLDDRQLSEATKEHTTARGDIKAFVSEIEKVDDSRQGPSTAEEKEAAAFHFSLYTPPNYQTDEVYDFNLFLFSSHCRSVKGFSLGGGLNFLSGDASGTHFSGIGNFVGGNSNSLQVAGVTNQVKGYGAGFQLAGIMNTVSQDMTGVQASLIYNYSGILNGAQVAFLANYVLSDFKYAQLAMGANLANGKAQGVQAAVGFNLAYQNLTGLQFAVGANIAADRIQGVQWALAGNAAGSVTGAQVGAFNLTREITGVQIGAFNFCENVNGGQIGLVNVAKSLKYVSVGAFNLVLDGETYINLWSESSRLMSFGLKHGTNKFYNLYYFGADTAVDRIFFGLGYGLYLYNHSDLFLAADVTAKIFNNRDKMFTENPALLASGRFSLGVNLLKGLALVGGLSYNYFDNYDNDTIAPPDPLLGYIAGNDRGRKIWVGFNLGLQFKLF